MKYFKYQRRVAIISLILLIITPFTTAYAASVEECEQALVDFSLSFVEATKNPSSKVRSHYSYNGYTSGESNPRNERAMAYLYEKQGEYCTYQPNSSGDMDYGTINNGINSMGMDCVGWVCFALHHCLGIGSNDQFTTFVCPGNQVGGYHDLLPYNGESSAIPGDILFMSGHVMIYVGDGKVVDCITSEDAAVDIRTIASSVSWRRDS